MGGTSKQSSKSDTITKTEPWNRAIPNLEENLNFISPQWANVGITGNEQAALSGLEANAQAGNPYAGRVGLLADDLLAGGTDRTGMVNDTLNEFRGGLLPYTTMSTDPYSNEAFTKYADQLSGDAMNSVKAQYAAAGYNPSAASFGKSVAEGVGRAVAPVWLQAQESLENRKGGAIRDLYSAGNTSAGILSGMDQTALGNRATGVDVASRSLAANDAPFTRMLEIEAQRRGLPIQNIAQLEQLLLPIAGLGQQGQSTTWSETSKTASPMEVAQGWAKVGTSIFGGGPNSVAASAKGWF